MVLFELRFILWGISYRLYYYYCCCCCYYYCCCCCCICDLTEYFDSVAISERMLILYSGKQFNFHALFGGGVRVAFII
jgi:hypothetical protein